MALEALIFSQADLSTFGSESSSCLKAGTFVKLNPVKFIQNNIISINFPGLANLETDFFLFSPAAVCIDHKIICACVCHQTNVLVPFQ